MDIIVWGQIVLDRLLSFAILNGFPGQVLISKHPVESPPAW